jgi:tellurite resistance protein
MSLETATQAIAQASEDLRRVKQADALGHTEMNQILTDMDALISETFKTAETALHEAITELRQHLELSTAAKTAAIDVALAGEPQQSGGNLRRDANGSLHP